VGHVVAVPAARGVGVLPAAVEEEPNRLTLGPVEGRRAGAVEEPRVEDRGARPRIPGRRRLLVGLAALRWVEDGLGGPRALARVIARGVDQHRDAPVDRPADPGVARLVAVVPGEVDAESDGEVVPVARAPVLRDVMEVIARLVDEAADAE